MSNVAYSKFVKRTTIHIISKTGCVNIRSINFINVVNDARFILVIKIVNGTGDNKFNEVIAILSEESNALTICPFGLDKRMDKPLVRSTVQPVELVLAGLRSNPICIQLSGIHVWLLKIPACLKQLPVTGTNRLVSLITNISK